MKNIRVIKTLNVRKIQNNIQLVKVNENKSAQVPNKIMNNSGLKY